MSWPTVFEKPLYFHAGDSMSIEARRKRLNVVPNAVNSTMTVMAVQIVQGWDPLTKSCSLGPLRVVIRPYSWFNAAVIEFQV